MLPSGIVFSLGPNLCGVKKSEFYCLSTISSKKILTQRTTRSSGGSAGQPETEVQPGVERHQAVTIFRAPLWKTQLQRSHTKAELYWNSGVNLVKLSFLRH